VALVAVAAVLVFGHGTVPAGTQFLYLILAIQL
jgi:hypothetical protein